MRDWNFYLAYNLFRLAAILQGIVKRARDGTAASAQAAQTAAGTRQLAEMGWRFAMNDNPKTPSASPPAGSSALLGRPGEG
jgi:hypothetical protein